MTALPDWLHDVGTADTDAELVRASLDGDGDAFGRMYDRYADRLHDFCIGMLGDREAAADCVQDVFCIAASRLPQLRDPDRLRPWLYAVARNEAMRRLRDRRRETPSEDLPDTATAEPGPEALAARTELADLVAEAAGGLSDRDRSVLELAFRHGLDGAELAQALGVTPTYAHTLTHRLRETVERSLGALLVSRHARRATACPELAALLEDWDGTFNVLIRKRISRHIESCGVCDDQRRRMVSPAALLVATPTFIPAPKELRGRVLPNVELPDAGRAGDGGRRGGLSRALFAVTLLLAIVGASGGLAYVVLHEETISITPTEVTETLPSAGTPTKSTAPSAPPAGGGQQSDAPSVLPPATSTTPTTTPSPVPPAQDVPPAVTAPPPLTRVTPEVDPVEPPVAEPDPIVPPRRSAGTPTTSQRATPPGVAGGTDAGPQAHVDQSAVGRQRRSRWRKLNPPHRGVAVP